jgi:K+-sensing histidine kinase KdpD
LSSKNYHPFVEEISASFIVNTISQVAAQYNRSKDLLLTVEGATMQTDKFLLKRVLEELTDNAFKFTHIGDAVNWDIFLLARGAKLDLEYPNLSKFNAEKFNNVAPCNQFLKENQVIEGLGLGLFLTQKIMKMLGNSLNFIETNSNMLRFQLGFRYLNDASNSEINGK